MIFDYYTIHQLLIIYVLSVSLLLGSNGCKLCQVNILSYEHYICFSSQGHYCNLGHTVANICRILCQVNITQQYEC